MTRLLRKHASLHDLIRRELPSVLNPRQTAIAIQSQTQNASGFVLYTDREGHWEVLPVGAAHPHKNIGQAANSTHAGKRPVAFTTLPAA